MQLSILDSASEITCEGGGGKAEGTESQGGGNSCQGEGAVC